VPGSGTATARQRSQPDPGYPSVSEMLAQSFSLVRTRSLSAQLGVLHGEDSHDSRVIEGRERACFATEANRRLQGMMHWPRALPR
jgi:hypothetical protein